MTREIKEKILGLNWARTHGLDVEEKRREISGDRWSELRKEGKAAPWSALRSRLQSQEAL